MDKTVNEVEVRGLTKVFGRRTVLDKVSFDIERGGFLTLLGPNGAGKTTLVRILATLIAPTSGEVRISGLPISDDSAAVRSKIGLISHSPLLYSDLTAEENLKFYGKLYSVEGLAGRIDELLDQVELDHRRFDLVRTFSKGMLQRLAIARALLHRPSILFLDEPHTGLDPHAVDILEGLLAYIRRDHTFVMITHNLEKALALSSSAMILVGGEIIFKKSREELDIEELKEIYRQNVKGEGA
ncbi:MAG: ABC transporter ATP-binding protein [Actinobacteria bacterium]|nr:ABC transporter ATP-binding protein [Actinomycetota bacterium]